MKDTVIYLVVPCYNEEKMLPITQKALSELLNDMISREKISQKSRMVFVDDGSKDNTWQIIERYCSSDPLVKGVKLSRNKGHQNALLAGLMTVKAECDAAISLDADLQDDIGAIEKMITEYENGCEIVFGVRSKREKDTLFKRATARGFYKVMRFMGADIIYDHADYRLMSRRALDELENFKEVNLFLRGIVPMIGFKTGTVLYERGVRTQGESKYPLKKMIAFAVDGITSLSIKPIRFITFLGLFILFASTAILIYSLVRHFMGHTVWGWTSLMVSIWAIGGLQLFAIGVVGEYVGKIYLETKARPKFIVDKYIGN
ncbi:MAG: glycosyltransferase family 2 protein [Clostridia bacterium]|nr:glycosyltransferase family 2 protein [Clostridia bacterium]